MSSVSYILTCDVVVPAWVVEQSSQEEACDLALAVVEVDSKDSVGAGWTQDGDASVDPKTGDLVVPLTGNACLRDGVASDDVRVTLNPYGSALDGVDGFESLSDDAFHHATCSLSLRNVKVTENRLAA